MIDDAAKKQFKFVLVYQLDRFARNRFDSATYKAKLKKSGVRVLSAKENITDDASGILVEGLLESMAEYYSAELSQKVVRGMKESAKKGLFNGGNIPLGYKVEDRRLVIHQENAELVRHIFKEYAAGKSIKELAQYLNERGMKNSRGNPFSNTGVRYILGNQRYIGVDLRENDELKYPCPQILDKDLYDAVQKRLEINRKSKRGSKAEYRLSGKLYCGKCNERMLGESGTSRNGNTYHYYSCSDRKQNHTCDKMNEKKDFIEWYVVEQTVKYVLEPERREYIATKIEEKIKEESAVSQIPVMERKLKKVEAEMARCVDKIISTDNKTIAKTYEERLEELAVQKDDLNIEISKQKNATGLVLSKKEIKAWLGLVCQGDPLNPDFQKKIIDIFIKRVYSYDNQVVIYYNIKNGCLTSGIESLKDSSLVESCGSDKEQFGGVNCCISEHNVYYIFNAEYFGIICMR